MKTVRAAKVHDAVLPEHRRQSSSATKSGTVLEGNPGMAASGPVSVSLARNVDPIEERRSLGSLELLPLCPTRWLSSIVTLYGKNRLCRLVPALPAASRIRTRVTPPADTAVTTEAQLSSEYSAYFKQAGAQLSTLNDVQCKLNRPTDEADSGLIDRPAQPL